MINIALLGASGSIGKQTIDVLNAHKDQFKLLTFSVGENISYAKELLEDFTDVEVVSFKNQQSDIPGIKTVSGEQGLIECATHPDVDIVVVAVVGFIGLIPTIKAIEAGKDIALANKETLVCAGDHVMSLVKKHKVKLIPVDSEHSAIYQCLDGQMDKSINKIILTASGGSFRDKTRSELSNVSVEETLNHPNWSMGASITIDSATMFNKGLEVIEAHHLFDVSYDQIEVLIHFESIIHSMVEMQDTSVLAQLGTADMRLPILYAIAEKKRLITKGFEHLNLAKIKTLNFKDVDLMRFPALKMSYDAGKVGGTMPTVLNAAKEVATQLFLENKITFLEIERVVFTALRDHELIESPSIEQIIQTDKDTRLKVTKEWSNTNE